jgi:hypothetical protein
MLIVGKADDRSLILPSFAPLTTVIELAIRQLDGADEQLEDQSRKLDAQHGAVQTDIDVVSKEISCTLIKEFDPDACPGLACC